MLRPARPHLDRCLRERDRHVAKRRELKEESSKAIRECEQQIVALREDVFAANDGFVGSRMTELERTWRRLSRVDSDAGMMELWTAIAPPTWVDQKRWRGAQGNSVDLATLLAADVDGVEAAEKAARALYPDRTRIAWRLAEDGADPTSNLATSADTVLAEAVVLAHQALAVSEKLPIIVARAQAMENDVQEIALTRFAQSPIAARAVGRVALAEYLIRAAELPAQQARVDALCALWSTGYVIAHADDTTITLEVPAPTAS